MYGALTGVIEDFCVMDAGGNHLSVCMTLMALMMSFVIGSLQKITIFFKLNTPYTG